MQNYTDLKWLDTRLEKLKLHLEELRSNLVHLVPRYKNPSPQFQDVERHPEYTKPRIDYFKQNFRGLESRLRTLRSLPQKLLVFGLVVLFLVSWSNFLRRGGASSARRRLESENPVFNTTLGVCLPAESLSYEGSANIRQKFQHIFALALPDRFDRVKPLLAAANASNIDVTILDALRDKQISEDAWPKGWSDNHEKKVGELGCLMSHVRTWKKMIAENIESALIMESDADWDLRIKETMQGVASASKRLVDWPFDVPTRPGIFPYGDRWDVIWLGHCGSWNTESHRIYSFNDSSVPPEDYEYTFTDKPLEEQHRPGTRSVFPLGFAVCSTAYAISNAGAVKLEKEFQEGSDNIDLRLAEICRKNQDFNCLGLWPQLITAAITKTNIEHPLGEIVTGEMAVTEWFPGPGLQYSARLNAEKVLNGSSSMEEWDPQWNSTWALKNETWTQVSFEEAKKLQAETESDGEEIKEGKGSFWQWYNGKYAGTRSFG